MPRLFFGNFDFEESLIRPAGQQKSVRMERILVELAATWVTVVRAGDLIWCPRPIDESFIDVLLAAGWPPFRLVWRREEIPARCEFVPWGWTPEAAAFGQSVGASMTSPPLDVVRKVNSRQFAFDLETSLGVRLESHSVASTWQELGDAIERCTLHSGKAVIKTEFSQAGRDRFVIGADDSTTHGPLQSWAHRQWGSGQRLFVEPWLDALAEVGVQFDVGPNADVTLIGVAEMVPSSHGGYAGSAVRAESGADEHWKAAVTVGMQAARAVAAEGYFGPLGIDAMLYRAKDGSLAIRPIQDVNARWTMGRLSLGLRRFVPAGVEARWLHGPALDNVLGETAARSASDQIISTSPKAIDERPVRHRTALVWIE